MMDQMNAFLRQGIYEQDYLEAITKKLIDMFAERRAPVRQDIITRTPSFAKIVR